MAQYSFGNRVVETSSDGRIVFPEVGVTKREVVDYYHRVTAHILPHLRDRPITMERYPKGLGGKGFYHKHAPAYFPAWIERADMPGADERVIYALCNLPETLVYLANQNTIALHVWTSRHQRPQHPDQLIFDLDPPQGRFDMVIEAALLLRDILTELGVVPYVKTSGSAGLHLVVALDAEADYGQVQRLAATVAERACARRPDLCTTEFYKKDRKGRLFIDTLRNTYGATAVAAYSLRARPNAPISTPLAWDEVGDPDLTADAFRIDNIDERLAQVGDPWSDLFDHPASAARALARLS